MPRLVAILAILMLAIHPASAAPAGLGDNADSVAIVVGNQTYRQTSPVDFAGNDAAAMADFLVRGLGFQQRNVFVLKDATLNELNQAFGPEQNPTAGRLWRSVAEGRSNVFVYYSGHGVPDVRTRRAYLLPSDGDPNFAESGYALETLYRNLELVKQKVGPDRQVIVMVDACFTGETGRKGENMLSVSAPGFAPAKPAAPGEVIRLAATSGATPANWDQSAKLGLFTSRFLMGAAGLARPQGSSGPVRWADLQAYVTREVETAARRDVGREQKPEIDAAPFVVPAVDPAPQIRQAVERARDEQSWRDAERDGSKPALERYVARCSGPCAYRDQAMAKLLDRNRGDAAEKDDEAWGRLSVAGKYQDYLDGCERGGNRVCAYRALALGYLGKEPTPAPSPQQPASPPSPVPDSGQLAALPPGDLSPPPAPPVASAGQKVNYEQLPRRKAGLWESKLDGANWSGTKECVGGSADDLGAMAWAQSASTCPYQAVRTKDGFELALRCGIGNMSAGSRGVVSGDFDNLVRIAVEFTIVSGVAGEKPTSAALTSTWRRVGACRAGMKPGDMIMPNGQITRAAP